MTERPEAKRREEALGWLVGRLAWEKGLRFQDTPAEAERSAAQVPAAPKAETKAKKAA